MLTVVYDKSDKDVPCICVMETGKGLSYTCLKMELGEQADILYRLLTEQMTKAEIKTESEEG